MSSTVASATSSVAAATSSAAAQLSVGKNLKVVGIILAIASGLLIGSSFVFKKKGLLRSQAGGHLGEGVAYLKSPLWWLGMTMMILGELCNFAAYAFVEAIVVTPLGALSVVICAILSSFFLNEKLSFFGWLGCALCILGSTIIALNGPKEASVGQIREFQKLFLAPGFLVYASVLIIASLVIIFFFAPKYGKNSMLWYISVCSMIGGISVSVTTGLGAAIVTTAMGDNQFKFWFMYFLMAFVVITLITEVYYLNVALALFNTAMVTPTYYVIFTFFSMVTTVVLFQGLQASATQIITLVMAFLVICLGITILQMSKVDPVQLSKLDRRSTILLQAARSQTETFDEKGALGVEDPGMDALRGSFGTVGSIIRARTVKRMSQSSHRTSHLRQRPAGAAAPYDTASGAMPWLSDSMAASPSDQYSGMKRHQLYDAPVPRDDVSSVHSQTPNKRPTIKFDSQDVIHQYNRPGTGNNESTHEHRPTLGSPRPSGVEGGYPPLPPPGSPSMATRTTIATDANLLDIDDSSSTPSTTGNNSRVIPSRVIGEHEVHSAPPTIYARFARAPQLPARKDSREVFEDSPTTARGTLLSFPSVTDSAMSQGWDEEEGHRDSIVEREKEKAREKERGRSAKRYPKGDGEDDREESVSLWRKDGTEESDADDDALPPDVNGGIRLVPTGSSSNRF
ncbi:magnesium transporter NIPA-domain-containing protein [Crucibulum laeve]|uniref:Magnesium transporter NIPA-domain-containing protein n=1 Tax=Crucibulum laeve TaxID=68775 RepID=A0A5C3MFB7_9AGAR|nr:magnesium transporter NIPA-domain-containing protein [Crucibulum laeve]